MGRVENDSRRIEDLDADERRVLTVRKLNPLFGPDDVELPGRRRLDGDERGQP